MPELKVNSPVEYTKNGKTKRGFVERVSKDGAFVTQESDVAIHVNKEDIKVLATTAVINASARLAATAINAEFDGRQMEVLKKVHSALMQLKWQTYNFVSNFQDPKTKDIPGYVHAFNSAVRPVNNFVIIGVLSGTPDFVPAYVKNRDALVASLTKADLKAVEEMGKAYKGAKNSPEAKYVALMVELYPLFAKSWKYMVKEVRAEFEANKQDGDDKLDPKDHAGISKLFKKIVDAQPGFAVVKPTSIPGFSYMSKFKYTWAARLLTDSKAVVGYNADKGVVVFLAQSQYDKLALCTGSLYFNQNYWHDFSRTGVDDGSSWVCATTHLPSAVKQHIQDAVKIVEHRMVLEEKGVTLNLGPTSVTVTPERLAEIVQSLKNDKTYSVTPSGFGTGYRFTIRKVAGAEPASPQIKEKVGVPVYYLEFDHD